MKISIITLFFSLLCLGYVQHIKTVEDWEQQVRIIEQALTENRIHELSTYYARSAQLEKRFSQYKSMYHNPLKLLQLSKEQTSLKREIKHVKMLSKDINAINGHIEFINFLRPHQDEFRAVIANPIALRALPTLSPQK